MLKDKKIKVGFSIGDLNGIGGELILKSLNDKSLFKLFTPVIYASDKIVSFLAEHFSTPNQFNVIRNIDSAFPSSINIINVWEEDVKINFGQSTHEAGHYSILSLKAAVNDLKSSLIDVLVTPPINKHNIQSKSFNFPGHTNFLSQQLKGESLMFMISDKIKIGLLTDHVPIAKVSSYINRDLIFKKVEIIDNSLRKDFGILAPKIALLGVNPHSGDNGVIGEEDDMILKPAIEKLKLSGKLIFGPFAADSFFGSENFKNFDAVLAAYHDQGLIPFKTLAFGSGVNFTAGLDMVRTSPDHGTAYEIAGKGIANAESFKQAIFSGIQIYKQRNKK
ncbi:MAG: 4-hydroxythreonine-4-phosphate dehydrogenase PdxA [Flavobacteriaceae bacterium]|nr:4-hydroxythreonine-4-phosphate dehydrogenase PdxA [Flavobacteriaceae bacterium]|tara:strand:+ start:64968 stop:65969 length:1002 start_codon:yes stop_codon:yes gene_type:complete